MTIVACSLCGLLAPQLASASIAVGGFVALSIVLQPLRRLLSPTMYGIHWPKLADVNSLLVLFVFPALLMLLALTEYEPIRVFPLSFVFFTLIVYVWLRSLWILDRLLISTGGKRFLFTAIVLPCILLTGYNIAHWAFGLPIIVNWTSESLIVGYTLATLVLVIPTTVVAYLGLSYIFPSAYRWSFKVKVGEIGGKRDKATRK